jgi:hypothetical protein
MKHASFLKLATRPTLPATISYELVEFCACAFVPEVFADWN